MTDLTIFVWVITGVNETPWYTCAWTARASPCPLREGGRRWLRAAPLELRSTPPVCLARPGDELELLRIPVFASSSHSSNRHTRRTCVRVVFTCVAHGTSVVSCLALPSGQRAVPHNLVLYVAFVLGGVSDYASVWHCLLICVQPLCAYQ